MMPYPNIPAPRLGPVELQVFGILVVTGVLLGVWVTLRRARDYGLDDELTRQAIWWLLLSGFFFGHVAVILLEHPRLAFSEPLTLLNPVAGGLSSYAGFFGALLALWLFCGCRRQPLAPYADAVTLGLIPGWFLGRLGCYLTHDHPGAHSDFFLAVAYPDGPRHDLGLYEALLTLLLFGVFEWLRRRSLPPGRIALLIALSYSSVRFFLDFPRVREARYGIFTLGQLGSLLMIAVCGALLVRSLKASGAATN